MTDPNYIERYIADFVDRHVSEKVRLKFGRNCIQIAPVKKRGSILLSMFWIKVLQHKNNYPPQTISYNQKKINGSEIIYLLTENVMISLDLLSGLLSFEGGDFIEWFRNRIMIIIRNYIGCKTNEDDVDCITTTDKSKILQKPKKIIQKEFKNSTVLEDDHLSNLMMGDVLDAACDSIRSSTLKPAHSWIYRFWKSLMYSWLSLNEQVQVIIATSKIDARRLRDIADIALFLRATSQIQAIYMPFKCDGKSKDYKTLSEIRRIVLDSYSSSEQLWIEYELLNKILLPKSSGIGCNFIAGIWSGLNKVNLMLTSCRFHESDLQKDTLHSVQFLEMSEVQFDRDFIVPLHGKISTSSI